MKAHKLEAFRADLARRLGVSESVVEVLLDQVVVGLLDLPKGRKLHWRGLGTWRWHRTKRRRVETPTGLVGRVRERWVLKFSQTRSHHGR